MHIDLRLKFKILFATTIISACSCNSNSSIQEDPSSQKSSTISSEVTSVTTSVSVRKQFEYCINSNGKIKSLHEQLFNSELGARVSALNVKNGSLINIGQVLIQFETESLEFKLERAKFNRFNCAKEYESQLLGYANLLKDKSKIEADAIRQKLKIGTGLSASEQEIKEAEFEIKKAIIVSPFKGVVSDLKIGRNDIVKQGQELFRIYDPNSLITEVKLLESDIRYLVKGAVTTIVPIANPEIKINGSVFEINPYVDDNGLILVKILIINLVKSESGQYRGAIFPGMNCAVTIRVPTETCTIIPKEALIIRGEKSVVFTIENGKAFWNYVKVGKDNGKEIEILDGLKPGLKVITSNNLQLTHGSPIKENKN